MSRVTSGSSDSVGDHATVTPAAGMIRRSYAERLDRRLVAGSSPLTAEEVERPAIVLAPHPDDETLGCGGLIALKRKLGVPVTVVFMTDGALSHAHLVDPDELRARRRIEAAHACSALGVEADSVHHIDVRDGALEVSADEAETLLTPLLRAVRSDQLIAPHPAESPLDHQATFHIADRALRRAGETMEALLYPVWLWDQFPFTNPWSAPRDRHSSRSIVHIAARDRLGARLPKLLTRRLDVTSVLDQKRDALEQHATQMVRQDGYSDWSTLRDIAGGDWLRRLLAPDEFYADRLVGGVGR